MKDARTDAIAREAARLLDSGRAASITEAVRLAANRPGWIEAPRPGPGRVRQHLQAMTMQAVGEAVYDEAVREVWRIAEEVMTVLEHAFEQIELTLVGRGAKGHIDGGVTVHIRAYTRHSISDLAAALVEHGYDEPSFETAETRLGRLSRLRLVEDGLEVVVTRCLPEMRREAGRDLFRGAPLPVLTLEELRRRTG
ncbi:MAG: hypothetical protein ACYTGG_02970 [Planctomycetota bacterium]|jgi:hypothetical protein